MMRKKLGVIFISSLLFTGGVYSAIEIFNLSVTQADSNSKNIFVQDELYFGRTKPGGIVSEAEFEKFLTTEVTPRFPDGLTVIDAKGQFRNSSGKMVKEPSKILILIYPSNQDKKQKIQEIINLYKSKFQQESVLRVTYTPAQVKF